MENWNVYHLAASDFCVGLQGEVWFQELQLQMETPIVRYSQYVAIKSWLSSTQETTQVILWQAPYFSWLSPYGKEMNKVYSYSIVFLFSGGYFTRTTKQPQLGARPKVQKALRGGRATEKLVAGQQLSGGGIGKSHSMVWSHWPLLRFHVDWGSTCLIYHCAKHLGPTECHHYRCICQHGYQFLG